MKALALISGGLDSILAAKLIQDQGVEVTGFHCKIPFCLQPRRSRKAPDTAGVMRKLGMGYEECVLAEEFLAIVKQPCHGHGANLNPCIDCKILMFTKAAQRMKELGASFLVTGEVIGQRPMSQNRQTLGLIERESGIEGLNLRPLSAKLLAATIPEQNGWIDRGKLCDFSGRSRRPQFDLAVRLGIIDYEQPAGGCLLTDPCFCVRLKDLLERGPYDLANVELLKVGRHYRLSPQAKLIVGRDEDDNMQIEKLAAAGDLLFLPPEDIAGPSALLRGQHTDSLLQLSAGIVARYCDLKARATVEISVMKLPSQEKTKIVASPVPDEESEKLRL